MLFHRKLNKNIFCFISINLFFFPIRSLAASKTDSKQVRLNISAEKLEGVKNEGEESYQVLTGTVVIENNDLIIYADFAKYYNDTKNIVADGNIKIVHKENGATFYADSIEYDNETKIAEAYGSIVIETDKARFTTNNMSYNTKTQCGYFRSRGELVEGENHLISDSGYYDRKSESAYFEENVQLNNEKYTLYTEKLHYNNITKIAKFKGKTSIISKDGTKNFTSEEGGEYNTRNQKASFKEGSLETDNFFVYADVIEADQKQEFYRITGNVVIEAKDTELKLVGEYATYDKKQKLYEIFGNTIISKKLEDDIMYMTAGKFFAKEIDSLSSENEKVEVEIYAVDGVKIYKKDLQAKADSLIYKEAESLIEIEGRPIFWTQNNQITADQAKIILQDKKLDKIVMTPNAFLVFKDDFENFNQIAGSEISVNFENNKVSNMKVSENVEVLYYAIDKKSVRGLNVLKCGEISIDLSEGNINKIDFPIKSQGIFYPAHSMDSINQKLLNFEWREDERPTYEEVAQAGFGTFENFEEFKFDN